MHILHSISLSTSLAAPGGLVRCQRTPTPPPPASIRRWYLWLSALQFKMWHQQQRLWQPGFRDKNALHLLSIWLPSSSCALQYPPCPTMTPPLLVLVKSAAPHSSFNKTYRTNADATTAIGRALLLACHRVTIEINFLSGIYTLQCSHPAVLLHFLEMW